MLAASLKKLMGKTKLNKISVQDITEDAGLNRQTFYYHFHNVFELLGWIYQTEALDSIAPYRSYSNWGEGFRRIFHYIEENRAFCLNTLDSIARSYLEDYLYNTTCGVIREVVEDIPASQRVDEADKHFLVQFYTLAFMGLIIQWMKNNMVEPPDLIVNKLEKMLNGQFLQALDSFSAREPLSE